MNYLNSNRLIMTGSVFLLLVGSVYFALQFSQIGNVDSLLRNKYESITSVEEMSWTGMQNQYEQLLMAARNDYPSFKNKTQPIFDDNTNSEVVFPDNTNREAIEPNKNSVTPSKREVENASNTSTYSSFQYKDAATYTTGIQTISSKTISFKNNNKLPAINIASEVVSNFTAKSPSFSNTSPNTFLANNSLSLTTDLSGNNDPMLIDGETNPGDPGVPVGDGTWLLMGLLVGYGLILSGRAVAFKLN